MNCVESRVLMRWQTSSNPHGLFFVCLSSLTLIGFASYYYGHLEPNRAIELNRCYYNTMVDNPVYHNKNTDSKMCRTMEPDLNCQDCRETPYQDIYSAHFTLCGKPEHCAFDHPVPLCRELHRKWHWFRTLLEREWIQKHPEYNPGVAVIKNSFSNKRVEIMREFGNHCNPNYIPMTFPSEIDTLIWCMNDILFGILEYSMITLLG